MIYKLQTELGLLEADIIKEHDDGSTYYVGALLSLPLIVMAENILDCKMALIAGANTIAHILEQEEIKRMEQLN